MQIIFLLYLLRYTYIDKFSFRHWSDTMSNYSLHEIKDNKKLEKQINLIK